MTEAKYPDDWPDIDTVLYDRSVKVFRSVKRLLGVNIELHADAQPEQGDIFLFNHFSRFETFVPQFLIYQRTGAYSCAIASSQFFEQDTALARYLKNVGVFPHDHPRLFPMLAAQILRGRKVIIFPEGGMVKDRDVMDAQGHYSVFSRISGKRRKHHTGPAVLAQGLEAFKTTVRNAYCKKEQQRLLQWQEDLRLDGLDRLLMAALKPTLIVPANITFYPIRSSENWLQKGVELFAERLTPRQTEELLIEGNILLKETDMDVRMGKPVNPCAVWHWWNRYVLDWLAPNFTSLDNLFALHSAPASLKQRLLGRYFRKCANATRDQYMADIYAHVTVNLSHLASSLIMDCIAKGQREIGKERFYTTLYIAVRQLQQNDRINLHRSLTRCDEYIDLIDGRSRRFEHFICLAKESDLIAEDAHHYRFEEKLCADYDLDAIRLENPIAVYCNEVAPVRDVREVLRKSLQDCDRLDRGRLAAWRLEDEHKALAEERRHYQEPRFDDINRLESADADPSPFFLQPEQPGNAGLLLIHGLLASPAEVRDYGEHLVQQGYTVLAVRLKGHGTSPYALRDQRWEDWYASVRRGFNILRLCCDRIVAVGFSTGGALALKLAVERGQEMVGVVALSLPIKFNNPAFRLLPLLHRTNRVVAWVSTYDGVKPFIQNATEHPRVNYTHVPVRSLDQLRQLIEHLEEGLPHIRIPTLLIHGDQDPVVSPKSAAALMDTLGSTDKRLALAPAARHGILMENLGGTWRLIDDFVDELMGIPAVEDEPHEGQARCSIHDFPSSAGRRRDNPAEETRS